MHDGMRFLTLTQPWATAMACGVKKIETRSWKTSYRGDIAIHAAKTWSTEDREFAEVEFTLSRLPRRMPLGAIVAVGRLVNCVPTSEVVVAIDPIEKMYGNYADGRWAWVFDSVQRLREPVPMKGAQGLRHLDPAIAVLVLEQVC